MTNLTARWVVAAICAVILMIAAPALAAPADLVQKHREMLYPVVVVATGSGLGSGTVIFSAEVDGAWQTYVLTNHHVVRSAITVKEEWDPKSQEEVKREQRSPVQVRWFDYNDYSREIGTRGQIADIVAYDATLDLALLQTRDTERGVDDVAHLMPEDAPLYLFEITWAVGAGLGKPPFPTEGAVSNLDQRIGGQPYILSSAPIIFGNSGGALFHWSPERSRYEFIGVPAKVSGTWSGVVTHMAWAIPLTTVREFLRDNDFGFILGDPAIEDIPEETEASAE
ncbi:hypothetical protein LCGC14_2075510 [marine sediment metagenome]|uniref:Serine protease n=1 Tax=marine sediment metagenome TaxID=412755 RepID=A0A0F9EHC7_9ZZZZ